MPGKNGSLYGITYAGGDFSCALTGRGTVFKTNHDGDLTLLHAFAGADGQNPKQNNGAVMTALGFL